MKLTHSLLLCVLPAILLSGCANRVVEADQKMQQIRSEKSQPVPPPPVPEKIEDFTYNANTLRSPFMPPSLLIEMNRTDKIKGVTRDETRIKEPLEQFEIGQLVYKGIIVSSTGEKYGLVQRPDGIVESVKVGNHLGKNDGRIVEITPTQMNLIELIPDSRVGYVEKPSSITSPAG